MPSAPPRPCPHPNCGRLVPGGGPCARHQRGSAADRGYSKAWAVYSRTFLRSHPWCGDRGYGAPVTHDSRCAQLGQLTPATQTDHITPHRGDLNLLWDAANHQALCRSCHSRKTAKFDGSFGR